MNNEIELCLFLPENKHQKFLKEIKNIYPQVDSPIERELLSVYYDTPTLDLAKRRMGLRLRREKKSWIQTVKLEKAKNTDGLKNRIELECVNATQALEIEKISHPDIREFLVQKKIASYLQPVFTTHIQRTQWQIKDANNNVVELVLDRGKIKCNTHFQSVSEIEIELKSGSIENIFATAQKLAAHFSFLPQLRSKAERGYRLFTNMETKPEKAKLPELHKNMQPWQARQTLIQECLRHLQLNLAEMAHNDDPEFVHQARVALRRMRCIDTAFSVLKVKELSKNSTMGLQALGRLLGQVRDYDILLHSTVIPVDVSLSPGKKVSSTIQDHLLTQRKQRMQQIYTALSSPRLGQELLQILQNLHLVSEPDATNTAVPRLKPLARDTLKRQAKAVWELADHWENLSSEQLHTLRKRIKKLRYCAEFFSTLYSERKTDKYLTALQSMQELLGLVNDTRVCTQILGVVAAEHPNTAFACGMVAGKYASIEKLALDQMRQSLRQMRKASPFWL